MSDTHILLAQGISQLGLELSPIPQSQLQHYMAALQKWNAAFNLTAIREPREIVIKHLLDSLSILPHLRGNTLLDVGTGAGFPALVLAIVKPDLQVDLLDSNSKKTRFLVQMVAELGLKKCQSASCPR
jgi:16S rRNA (guanine527-N7)-methyltransferase